MWMKITAINNNMYALVNLLYSISWILGVEIYSITPVLTIPGGSIIINPSNCCSEDRT